MDIFVRNPSEYARLVAERSEQLQTLQRSKNLIAKEDELFHLYDMVWSSKPIAKSDKERMIARVRVLERELGVDSRSYNGYTK